MNMLAIHQGHKEKGVEEPLFMKGVDGAIEAAPSALAAMVEVALRIANERATILEQLRASILANDSETALAFARRLCGIEDESQEKHPWGRARSSLHGGTSERITGGHTRSTRSHPKDR